MTADTSAEKAKVSAKKAQKKEHKETKLQKKGTILSFRRGRHNQKTNQFLVEVEGCGTKAGAALYIGKKVVWTSPAKKQITGKITAPHGNSGILRARFSRGLPGIAVTQRVKFS